MVQVSKPVRLTAGYVVLNESRKLLLLQSKTGFEVRIKPKSKGGLFIQALSDQQFYDGDSWFYIKRSNAEKKFAELSRGTTPRNCSL